MITDLFAVAAYSAPGSVGALNRAIPHAFGVERAAAVIVLIFVFSLGSMILGGNLRASHQRNRADKQR